MNIQQYIESGILEQYCLGLLTPAEARDVVKLTLLYPELKHELTAIETTMEKFALANAVKPASQIKQKLLASFDFNNSVLDINNLPPTSKYSNYQSWLNAVEHLIPARPFDDFFMEVLQQGEHIMQALVVTRLDVPVETHTDINESFFILQGQCQCTVGEHVYTLNPGDHLDIPLHIPHDIKITSPYVIAILQHQL